MKRGLVLLGATLMLSATLLATGEVTIGVKAPELKVAKWFKGKPVTKFEKGKVYVVEFWATWCGPCKASIPHLTEMAKKYKGKADFVGVSVWENPNGTWAPGTFDKITAFVKDFGAKMDYNVAADGQDAFMAENWMTAASQNGIPTAFIVDQAGEIAWIGHPMMGLDEAVGDVVAKKFDKAAFKAKFSAGQEAQKKEMALAAQRKELLKPMNDALKAGNFTEAIGHLDNVAAKHPEMAKGLAMTKFNILLRSDEAEAMKYASTTSETLLKDDPMMLNQIAWNLVDDASKIKKPDYDVAIKLALRACEITKYEDPMILDTLAYAYFKGGQIDKAIEFQEKAVAGLDKAQADEQTKKEIKDRLAMFKEKKKGG
jgi:thiol-disulfide isomerase/thioredoxin